MTAGERIVAFARPGKPPENWFFAAYRASMVNARYAPNLGRSSVGLSVESRAASSSSGGIP